jgi:hypothetical protein
VPFTQEEIATLRKADARIDREMDYQDRKRASARAWKARHRAKDPEAWRARKLAERNRDSRS